MKAIGNGLSVSANGIMDNKSMSYYYNHCTVSNINSTNINDTYKFKQQSTYLVNLTVNMNKILEQLLKHVLKMCIY